MTGITRQTVAAVESGRAQPGVSVALALAKALRSSVEELFGQVHPSIDAELTAPPAGTKRAVAAVIDGRVVARPLDARETPLGQPAGALIVSASRGRAQIEPLGDRPTLETTIFLSGCEPALGLLAGHVNAGGGHAVWFAASNREALYDLADRRVHAAALHGNDLDLRRLVRRLDADVALVELAAIEEGWLVARDNPLRLHGARDLDRAGVRLANRPSGSAARALLDAELRRAGLASRDVAGYGQSLPGHADVARAIVAGYADVAIGVAAIAETFKLSFVPLRHERCVLAMRRSDFKHAGVATLLAALRSTGFRRDLQAVGAYDLRRLGEAV